MTPLVFYTDRSAAETDWRCPRARYWNREYRGRGIVTAGGSGRARGQGTLIHRLIEGLARGEDLAMVVKQIEDEIVGPTLQGLTEEQQRDALTLAEGIVRAFGIYLWPTILRDYDVLAVEEEADRAIGRVILPNPSEDPEQPTIEGIILHQSRPDLLLRGKADGAVVLWDWKSTGSRDAKWLNQWPRAIQLHATARAVGAAKGLNIDYIKVGGLFTGYTDKEGRRRSILTYGWRYQDGLNETWSSVECRRKGWEVAPTSEYPGGVEAWVREQLSPEQIDSLFPVTPPIQIDDQLVEAYERQRVLRETDVILARGHHDDPQMMDAVFPQVFSQCRPGWGEACRYEMCCWSRTVGADPVGSGLFQWREPHHASERAAFVTKGWAQP